ncbi:hypothetical protein IWX90DRAFT_117619 [Phyllosticta citrichinensis]|uniref:Uncharacterized protein n=1 Tax=Phyllosticta citrichinensis TaxID=1130410 RepID=A0ABR1Y3T4_9PEZI
MGTTCLAGWLSTKTRGHRMYVAVQSHSSATCLGEAKGERGRTRRRHDGHHWLPQSFATAKIPGLELACVAGKQARWLSRPSGAVRSGSLLEARGTQRTDDRNGAAASLSLCSFPLSGLRTMTCSIRNVLRTRGRQHKRHTQTHKVQGRKKP